MSQQEHENEKTTEAVIEAIAETETEATTGVRATVGKIKKLPPNKKKLLLIVLAIVILFVGFRIVSARMGGTQSDEKMSVNVEATTVERATIQVETPLSAKIEPKNQAAIPAAVQSEITGVYVEVGQYVTKGTKLFSQDAAQIKGSYDQAAAAANIAKESLSSAKTNYERMSLLYKEGAASQQQYEQAQTQYATAKQQLSQSQAALSAASSVLENANPTAPIDGYVTEVNITQGAYPPQGAAVSIADTSVLEINTAVSEYLINKVKAGSKVNIVIKASSDTPYVGTITNVAPAPALGTLTYPITVKIDEHQEGIMAGMFAEVQVVSDIRENVLAIPSKALLIKAGETQVAVLDKENKPSFVTVEAGLDNGSMVEIISGLKEGQTVVCVGQNYVVEGEAVTIQNPADDSQKSKTE